MKPESEKIFNWDFINFLERPRAIKLLLVLKENTPRKKYTLSQILNIVGGSAETLMRRIRELQSIGLIIKTASDDKSKITYQLTPKGMKIAEKLEEVLKLIETDKEE